VQYIQVQQDNVVEINEFLEPTGLVGSWVTYGEGEAAIHEFLITDGDGHDYTPSLTNWLRYDEENDAPFKGFGYISDADYKSMNEVQPDVEPAN
jgi:hypothetical protein